MSNGIAKVELTRNKDNDDYSIFIDNMRSGELLQAIIQLTSTLAKGTGEPIENIIGSIYQGCLTPDELAKLQAEVDEHNSYVDQLAEAVGVKNEEI